MNLVDLMSESSSSAFYDDDDQWFRDITTSNEQELLELTDRILETDRGTQTLLVSFITGARYAVHLPSRREDPQSFYYTALPNPDEQEHAHRINCYTWDWEIGRDTAEIDLWEYYLQHGSCTEEEAALVYLIGTQAIRRLEVNCTHQDTYTTWHGDRISYEETIVDQEILDLVLSLRPREKIVWKYITPPRRAVPPNLIERMRGSQFNGGMNRFGYFLG